MLRFLLCVATCLHLAHLASEPLKVDVVARAAILMNAETGSILFFKEHEAEHYPASTTKIATALCVLEQCGDHLDRKVVASQEAIGSVSSDEKKRSDYQLPAHRLETGGSHIGIKRAEELSLRVLLEGLLVASGNDAANVLAEAVGGTIPHFVGGMNERLWRLGCAHTFFTNPHGLHHPEHVTCAYDLALMAREALKYPLFCEIVRSTVFNRPQTNKQPAATMPQTNRLLRPGKHYYPYAIGVKTGRTSVAKSNLVAAADDGHRTLIAVLLGCEKLSCACDDAIALFNAAFEEEPVRALVACPRSYTLDIDDAAQPLQSATKDEILIDYYPSDPPLLRASVAWDSLTLPIEKGQHVGELHILDGCGDLVGLAPLYAEGKVHQRLPKGPLLLVGGLGGLCLIIGRRLRRR